MVIGVGNAWRGDDAAGLAVARRLRGTLDALEHEGDGAGLVEAWRDRYDVVVVDAATSSGASPGTVSRFDAHDGPLPARVLRSSTHAFGVADAVELARALGRLPPRLAVYAIEGADFTAGTGLSPPVAAAVDRLAAAIAAGAGAG
jgi:hydrogenase maturation protease